MEWTTESGEQQAPVAGNGHGQPSAPANGHDQLATPANGHETQPLHAQPNQSREHFPEESWTPPVTHAPLPVPTHAAPAPVATPQAPAGYEHCPSCGALVAVDQRYCLECGHRRGEPRLPFMDAVVFMDAMNRPPETAPASTKPKKRGISPNAALIAGVGTLLLALGLGVLIGRSGEHGSAPAAAPQVVTVSGGGGEETASASSSSGAGSETTGAGASTKGKTKKQTVKQKSKEAASGAGAAQVLHYKNGVKPPPAEVKIGGKCEKGVAGCSKSGKFNGSFFGEEE